MARLPRYVLPGQLQHVIQRNGATTDRRCLPISQKSQKGQTRLNQGFRIN